jgi:hypothetical protein
MPQVRLTPQDDGGVHLDDGRSPAVYLPQLRLRLWVKVGTEYRIRQAVLDTGAPAAVFSRAVWEPLAARGEIEWVCHAPGGDDRPLLPRTAVLRGRYPFRLGRVTIQPVDLNAGELRPAPLLVQCTEDDPRAAADPEPLPRLLILGMSGFLNGRSLAVAASPDGATWTATLSE